MLEASLYKLVARDALVGLTRRIYFSENRHSFYGIFFYNDPSYQAAIAALKELIIAGPKNDNLKEPQTCHDSRLLEYLIKLAESTQHAILEIERLPELARVRELKDNLTYWIFLPDDQLILLPFYPELSGPTFRFVSGSWAPSDDCCKGNGDFCFYTIDLGWLSLTGRKVDVSNRRFSSRPPQTREAAASQPFFPSSS